MLSKIQVYCTAEIEACHYYEGAASNVSFLRVPHRHLFKVKLTVNTEALDRGVEFITMKHHLQEALRHVMEYELPEYMPGDQESQDAKLSKQLGMPVFSASCETIAAEIYRYMKENCRHYNIAEIEVSEDGENGAKLIYS
jgi:6-pyruvoyl-tetrahydropterin synthase